MVGDPGGTVGRARAVARNVVLLGRTALRHLEDDPVLLAVQSVRRLPPPARAKVARALGRMARTGSADARGASVLTAFAAYLSDHPGTAKELLARTHAPSRIRRRLRDELAVAVGAEAPADAVPAARARSAWARGSVSGAVAALDGHPRGGAARYRQRLESEQRLLTPGARLTPPPVARAPRPGGTRALHVLTNSLPWTQSGYSLRSHAILRAQASAGLTVEAVTRIGYPVIVGLPRARDVDKVDGITYRRVLAARLAATPEARLQQMVDALAPMVSAFRPTVLHTTTNFHNALVTQAVAAGADLPWIYEVRGQLEKTWLASRPEETRAEAAQSERYLMSRERELEMALAADHVVTLSQSLRADLIARGVPAERISVVPNAVPVAALGQGDPVPPTQARAALGLPTGGFWVGSVSSIVDYEGLDVLVDAVAQLRADGHDVRCAIVGDGVSRPGLVAQVHRLGLEDAVVLPGRVPREQAAQWHRALDAFVVPRRDVEVCRTVSPLKPIEAMAAGRPVVASDLPALAEVVAAPESGLLFRPGNTADLASTLLRVSADPALASRLADNGRTFAATRTWEAQAETYRQIYDRLGSAR